MTTATKSAPAAKDGAEQPVLLAADHLKQYFPIKKGLLIDRVVGNVQQVAGEKLDQAQHIAADVGRTAMEEAKSQAKSQGMMSGSQSASSSPA